MVIVRDAERINCKAADARNALYLSSFFLQAIPCRVDLGVFLMDGVIDDQR